MKMAATIYHSQTFVKKQLITPEKDKPKTTTPKSPVGKQPPPDSIGVSPITVEFFNAVCFDSVHVDGVAWMDFFAIPWSSTFNNTTWHREQQGS